MASHRVPNIAGALEGIPNICVQNDYTGEITASDKARQLLSLSNEHFGLKEDLVSLNGTAFRCGMARNLLA